MADQPAIDVLGLGVTAVDELLTVRSFPAADEKTQVLSRDRQCGGLTATALVAASRLGARCAFAGQLGDDELSVYVRDALQREGVDTSLAAARPGAAPVHSVIIVGNEGQTRNIFFHVPPRCGADEQWPDERTIRRCRVLFVDHCGLKGNLRAMAIARAAGIPVVADVEAETREPLVDELLDQVDHLILSAGFVRRYLGKNDPAEAITSLSHSRRQMVVVTCGKDGCFWKEQDGGIVHQPAFRVDVVDTTGCGDVFHGAYAARLAAGMSGRERIRFAAAAAALKATQLGGQRGIPTRRQVEQFLAQQL